MGLLLWPRLPLLSRKKMGHFPSTLSYVFLSYVSGLCPRRQACIQGAEASPCLLLLSHIYSSRYFILFIIFWATPVAFGILGQGIAGSLALCANPLCHKGTLALVFFFFFLGPRQPCGSSQASCWPTPQPEQCAPQLTAKPTEQGQGSNPRPHGY